MKTLFFSFLLAMAMVSSCKKGTDFLEKTQTSDLNEASVFADSARTMDALVGIYTDIGNFAAHDRYSGAGLTAASDEAEASLISAAQEFIKWATSGISAINTRDDVWSPCYANIRRVNIFLKNVPNSPLSAGLKSRVIGEARFLRAWYYFQLVKHLGGVVLIGENIYGTQDGIPGKRNTYEECVNYITAECDAAAALLPLEQVSQDYGRITKGACLALKARMLLYAASPLFNGGGIATDAGLKAITGYPSASNDRWLKAAQAADAVIQMGIYQLNEDNATAPGYGFYKVFTLRKNSEYILARMAAINKTLETFYDPSSRGGSANAFPYQELVDDFEMKNGKPISDPTSGYNPANPYLNRDPRLAYTVLFNGGIRLDRNTSKPAVVYTNTGSPDGGSKTGYYVFKMLDDASINVGSFPSTQRCFPLMRYAEILLNKAEALNEFQGPTPEVYNTVELVRKRAGLLPFQLPAGLSQEKMRQRIRNERRVELAYEEHRFWDVRRWKIAEQTDNRMLKGMKVTRLQNGTFTYEIVPVRQHTFRPAMYLFPIPQTEISKSADGSLQQNPGW
ncbi:RagB/SusD family nutrient uptake outer membrane protein [Daejeonella sp.]|uniref:RagB/SusD family nutrient uptake outer membrane protein n=1 Tax=Daejeonella sp. TaxID=2805397 RepID=UPI0030BEF7DB